MRAGNNTRRLPVVLPVIFLLLAILAYNYWSYQCGYCTMASLMSFSWPAVLLLGCNLLAVLVLLCLRMRSKRLLRRQLCDCGARLLSSWSYCPACGQQRQAGFSSE